MICDCWLIIGADDIEYLDTNRRFRKPTADEISALHYITTEQALDRAASVCSTMCGLRVCYENFSGSKDGHYGAVAGKRLKWARYNKGERATCVNCWAAENEATFTGRPEKEHAR